MLPQGTIEKVLAVAIVTLQCRSPLGGDCASAKLWPRRLQRLEPWWLPEGKNPSQ